MSWANEIARAYHDGLEAGKADKKKGIINPDPPDGEEFGAAWREGYQHGWNATQD